MKDLTMKHSLFIYILLFMFVITTASAQEVLHSLDSNPIKQLSSSHENIQKSADAQTNATRTVALPFWDDFSYNGPYPDPMLWADNFVFINNNYAVHPKTIGVATFDALDQYGALYEHMTASNTPYIADYLTSQYVRLDSVFAPAARALSPADSVLLSFYYQPQGKAGGPIRQDSLVVEFLYAPGRFVLEEGEVVWIEDEWRSVWNTSGMSLQEFSQDTFPYFKRATIKITNPVYFRKDFRFRFKNHVSFPIAGNPTLQNNIGTRAIWNVDYILLDHNRRVSQQNYFDIAFVAPPQSILKNYAQMPWSHYIANPQAHLRENFSMDITNLDNTTYPYSYRYIVQDEAGNSFRNYSGGTWNIAPFATSGYQQYQPHAKPIVIANPLPTAPAAERHFNIVHIIRAGAAGDSRQRNDTLTYRQSFQDYFAYDDGVPEGGYGVKGIFPSIASRYELSTSDFLSAIDIYLNKTINNSTSKKPFKVVVWKSIHPEEEILYTSENVFIDPEDELNSFIRFELPSGIQIDGTFYVGIIHQGNIQDDDFMSIGFDISKNNSQHQFFKTYNGQDWEPSIKQGSLMIRPVFGNIKSPLSNGHAPRSGASFTIYPNPLSGQVLHIDIPTEGTAAEPMRMDIIDMYGKMVYSGRYTPTFDATYLPNGMYFLRILHTPGQTPETSPFIIAR